MSSKQLTSEKLRTSFGLKLIELESVFKTQCELSDQTEHIIQLELKKIKCDLDDTRKRLRKEVAESHKLEQKLKESEEMNKKFRAELAEKDAEILNRDATILILDEKILAKTEEAEKATEIMKKSEAEVLTVNEKMDEKIKGNEDAIENLKRAEMRIENLKVDLSGYLKTLGETKKSFQSADRDANYYCGMYKQVKEQIEVLKIEFEGMKDDYEMKNELNEEFIQHLLDALKENGITEFTCNPNAVSSQSDYEDIGEPRPKSYDEEKQKKSFKPPLRMYPHWRPSPDMTTIPEEDENCSEADDAKPDEKEKLDPPIEPDLPSTSANIELPSAPPRPPPPIIKSVPAHEVHSITVTVDKPAEIVITIESDNEEILPPKKPTKADSGVQIDLDAEEAARRDLAQASPCSVSLKSTSVSVKSTPSDESLVNATDDGKAAKKKTKKRSKKKKNCNPKPEEEKPKTKRRFSKFLTLGVYH